MQIYKMIAYRNHFMRLKRVISLLTISVLDGMTGGIKITVMNDVVFGGVIRLKNG